jgi:hypothetical protein
MVVVVERAPGSFAVVRVADEFPPFPHDVANKTAPTTASAHPTTAHPLLR